MNQVVFYKVASSVSASQVRYEGSAKICLSDAVLEYITALPEQHISIPRKCM